jgi:hypothetical protein
MTIFKTLVHVSWILTSFCVGQAMAADPAAPKTREQVKAETREAIRTGDMPADGEIGCKRNELNPSQYPPKPAASGGKTREQVKAETREAMRSGEMSTAGELGCGPQVVKPQGPGKTRAQVKAERDEAIRNGEMPAAGEWGGTPQPRSAAPKKTP